MKLAFAFAVLVALAPTAAAFEIESPVSAACHEEITLAAALAAGFPDFTAAPPATEEQRRAMDDLVFDLPRADPWGLALFLGVRSNDLGDNAPTDLEGLVHVHDDPAEQPAHCIRRQEDDGADGDAGALAACRAFILGELEAGGLLDDTIDLERTEPVAAFFLFRGRYEIELPRFAYRLGRAVHALEDGYAHSMRDPASGAVRHVLNWIDAYGSTEYDEARDGYPHLSALDDCRNPAAHERARVAHATAAVTALLAAIAAPGPDRRARVTAAVDAAFVRMPGCDQTNGYCDAPELAEPVGVRSFGCTVAGASGALGVLGACALIVLRARRRRRVSAATLGGALVGVLALASADARAQAPADPWTAPSAPASEPDPTGPEAAHVVAADASDVWHTDHWHFDARAGGSIDDAGIGGMVGLGRTLGRWNVGVLAEWNPWFSFDRAAARPGVFNFYAHGAYRWFRGTRLTIATRVELGSSTMLFELLGVDKYTTGVYLGGALATIRFPISRRVAIDFDPVHFAMPTPRPFGLPFYYKQYRVTFGVEVRL